METDQEYENWFMQHCPHSNTYSPTIKDNYEPRHIFLKEGKGEYDIDVLIHDKENQETTPGSFRILGDTTRIIKYHDDPRSNDNTVLFLPTAALRFTKREQAVLPLGGTIVKHISYGVFIDDTEENMRQTTIQV